MPRFDNQNPAAGWADAEDWYGPIPLHAAETSPRSPSPSVLAILNQIQILTETLCETRLDAMQSELVSFLADAGVMLQQELLGEARPAPIPRPNVEDELEIEEVELLDDLSHVIELSPATQDYLDFELEDDLYEATAVAVLVAEEIAGDEDLLDDIEVVDHDVPAIAETSSATGSLHDLRILIADDNAAQQRASRLLFEGLGARCNACNNAAVVELACVPGWDAILLDVQIAARDSVSRIRAVRAQEAQNQKRRTPLFVTVANALPDQIREWLNAGADGYIAKPLSKAAVAAQFEVLALERRLEQRA